MSRGQRLAKLENHSSCGYSAKNTGAAGGWGGGGRPEGVSSDASGAATVLFPVHPPFSLREWGGSTHNALGVF